MFAIIITASLLTYASWAYCSHHADARHISKGIEWKHPERHQTVSDKAKHSKEDKQHKKDGNHQKPAPKETPPDKGTYDQSDKRGDHLNRDRNDGQQYPGGEKIEPRQGTDA
jgi:hypothetical protein